MNFINEKRVKCTKEHYAGRTVVIYGAGKNLGTIKKKIEEFTDDIVIVDMYKYDNKKILSPEVLNGCSSQYYVIVSILERHDEISELLEGYKYRKIKDYSYLFADSIQDFKIIVEDYQDDYGNKVTGRLNGAKVRFLGYNSVINAGEHLRGSGLEITVGSNASLVIGDNVVAEQRVRWELRNNASLNIGSKTRWLQKGGVICCDEDSICRIGKNCSFRNDFFKVYGNTKLEIGDNSLFASNVYIRTNDGHFIYDIKTEKCINDASFLKREVILGEHVWIGQNVTILYNTVLGEGSIVGAGSIVKGKFPNNCIIAGVTAKIIRKDVAWSGNYLENGLFDIPENYRKYTENKKTEAEEF